MPDRFQRRRIAEWLQAATLGSASLQRDLVAFEALHDGPLAGNSGRGNVAVTLPAFDALCRAKRSGLLSPQQVERLRSTLPEIARRSATLMRLGFRLKPSILEELEILR